MVLASAVLDFYLVPENEFFVFKCGERYLLDFNVTIFKRNYFKFLDLYLFEAF